MLIFTAANPSRKELFLHRSVLDMRLDEGTDHPFLSYMSLSGDMQAVSTAPPAEAVALLHPSASILPPTQLPPVWERAASLSDVFVPLSAIKLSECPDVQRLADTCFCSIQVRSSVL